jgi:hypothetical protein
MSKSLLTTNPFLRDPKARWTALRVSAASSSAVEGIRKPFAKPGNATAAATKPARRKGAGSAG